METEVWPYCKPETATCLGLQMRIRKEGGELLKELDKSNRNEVIGSLLVHRHRKHTEE